MIICDNFDHFWQLWQFLTTLTILETCDFWDTDYIFWQFLTTLTILWLATFETLITILTIENLNLWQSLLPDNKERHWTAFAILAMFFIGNFWTQYNHIDHTFEWFQFMWMLILFNLIPQLLHFIQNSTTLLYGFISCEC